MVPALWHLELANGFVVAERCGVLKATDTVLAAAAIAELLGHAIKSGTDLVSIHQALGTARNFQLSAYDAVYLDSALSRQLPLATLDRRRMRGERPTSRYSPDLLPRTSYFKYSESFFNSSGTVGMGGQSCEYPLSSGVATSERAVPS